MNVLLCKNFYFENMNSSQGIYILKSVKDDGLYPVTSMHEVQVMTTN
jgi:hypothetical protein